MKALNARSEVYLSKVYFCKMYPARVMCMKAFRVYFMISGGINFCYTFFSGRDPLAQLQLHKHMRLLSQVANHDHYHHYHHYLLIPASPYCAFCSLKCFCIVLPANFSSRAAQKLVIYMKVTPSYYRYQYAVYPNKFEAKNIFGTFLSYQRTVPRLIPLPPRSSIYLYWNLFLINRMMVSDKKKRVTWPVT